MLPGLIFPFLHIELWYGICTCADHGLSPQCEASRRDFLKEKSMSSLFVRDGGVVTNDAPVFCNHSSYGAGE